MKDLTQEEAGRWMDVAPLNIQRAVTSDSTQKIYEGLITKYGLHSDVGGIVAKMTSYVLLGYASPQQFKEVLHNAGISDSIVTQILNDINEKIFVPLREQMRNSENVVAKPVEPAPYSPPAPPQPQRPPAVNAQVPSYASSAGISNKVQGERQSSIPQSQPAPLKPYPLPLTPSPASVQTANSTPRFAQQENRIAPLPPRFGASRPVFTASPRPVPERKMLEDHEEPHIEFRSSQPAPPPVMRSEPVARTASISHAEVAVPTDVGGPPENLPGVIQPPPSIPQPPRPIPPPPAPMGPIPPPYSSDPYREPIEGQ